MWRILTVGATTTQDQRWVQSSTVGSNYGSKVDLFAPGSGIQTDLASADNQVLSKGTSLATPFVSGVSALYLQNHPTATPDDEVIAWIKSVATVGVLDETYVSLGAGSPNRLLYSASCD